MQIKQIQFAERMTKSELISIIALQQQALAAYDAALTAIASHKTNPVDPIGSVVYSYSAVKLIAIQARDAVRGGLDR